MKSHIFQGQPACPSRSPCLVEHLTMLTLTCRTSGRSWPLNKGAHTIGRSSDCQIRIDDPHISRHHARILVEDDSMRIMDLDSKNGVFINGSKVLESVFHPGDRISLGSVELLISEDIKGTTSPPDEHLRGAIRQETVVERGVISTTPSLDTTRLKVLYDVVEAVVTHLSLKEILPAVLDTLERLFSYDRCTLALKNTEGKLVTKASRPAGVKVPYSRTVASRVLNQGDALLYDDIQGEAPFDLGESVMGLNIHSVICSPLIFRGEIKGLVYLDRTVAGSYSVDDLALLRSISNLVAIGLENARLYSELQKRYEEKAKELKEVQRRLIQSERTAALGHLAQAMAHNIRNPLMILGGVTKRIKKSLDRGQQIDAKDLEPVLYQAEKLEKIMRRVDSLIRLPEAAPRLLPLEDTIADAVRDCSQGGQNIKIRSSLNRRPIPHDPLLTKTALTTVLQDAITTKEGCLYIRTGELPHGWYIEVSDIDSPGSDLEYKEIFDPFFRSHPWSIDMGLTLSQRAMDYQGGDLQIAAGPSPGNSVKLIFRSGP